MFFSTAKDSNIAEEFVKCESYQAGTDKTSIYLITTDEESDHIQIYIKFIEQETNPTILLGTLLIDIGDANYVRFYFEYLLETPMRYEQDLLNICHNFGSCNSCTRKFS
ncbi:hypothetical protein I4U23_026387 [Adineta vaga]|nr:hypothetical protein I4U23_026387 [Adineta vaga]